MADTIVVFYFVNAVVKCAAHFQVIVTGHHQRLRLCWFSLQVCGLPLSCRHHVKELCCVPQGGLALSILPGHGRHCSYATAVALIARGHEVDQTSECA